MATIEQNSQLGQQITEDAKRHVLYSWSVQDAINPIAVAGGEGRYFWDYDGKRYLDFASQLVNLSLGHQHPKLVAAIKEQADRLCTIGPPMATESRSRLGRLLSEVTPGNLSSQIGVRCAVVRAVMPLPIRPRSSTTTERPVSASSYAADRPAMPEPITTTSACSSSLSARVPRATSTSIQRDLVRSSLTFMAATPSPEMATPRLQLSFRDVIGRGHRTPQEHQRARHVDVAMCSSRRGLRVTPVTERNGHGIVLERHQDDG